MRHGRTEALGALAAASWALLVVRWFDAAAPLRHAWLAAVAPILLAVPCVVLTWLWTRARWPDIRGPVLESRPSPLLFVLALTLVFRLPLAWQGAAGYVTPDGALSGIVALHVRDGIDRLVFVPHVPYSGSLKSHLTAPLAAVIDPARAFALVSIFFYVLFVAAVHRLARLAAPERPWTSLAAGLYLAFAPAFVTRYSLSNDGNYVEVLALGTWALVLAARWLQSREPPTSSSAAVAGILLGLALWSHILAAIHVAVVGLALLAAGRRRTLRPAARFGGGLALGYLPGLLWNAGEGGWASFRYLVGAESVGAVGEGPGIRGRAWAVASDQLPVLLGYDFGYARAVDLLVRDAAWIAVALVLLATVLAARAAVRERNGALKVLLLLVVVNVAVAVAALPAIPGNPRYLLFSMTAIAVFLARALDDRLRRLAMAALVAFGAVGSLAQAIPTMRSDGQWRAFARTLEQEGVRWCYTDFYIATKVNFLSEERVTCSSKLGPTTTEYFFEYRQRVEGAPEAALIAVNPTAAEKLERRLERLGVTYERRDLMKPVLLRLSRKVDPSELFPDRDFPWR
jgi:hypothetical protein